MKYQCEIVIDANIELVSKSYFDHDILQKWDTGLIRVKPGDSPNQYYLHYRWGEEEMRMKETFEEINLPNRVVVTYEVPGAWNRCVNQFFEENGKTRFVMDVEFIFDKDPNIPIEVFKEKTLTGMKLYKNYIEKGEK